MRSTHTLHIRAKYYKKPQRKYNNHTAEKTFLKDLPCLVYIKQRTDIWPILEMYSRNLVTTASVNLPASFGSGSRCMLVCARVCLLIFCLMHVFWGADGGLPTSTARVVLLIVFIYIVLGVI